MQFKLRPYQEAAIQRMMENPYHYVAFDMGLGKTVTVLEYIRRTGKKAIIFAPLLVAQRTWPAEIKKWGFDYECVVLHGKQKLAAIESDARVIITNYASIKWIYEYASQHGGKFLRDRVVVFDESTAFKRPSSQRFKMLQAMQHLFKSGVFNLSGEPVPEGYAGLWSQYWVLDRGKALGSTYAEYKARYFYDSGPPRWILRLKNQFLTEVIQECVAHETSVLRAEDYIDMPEAIYQDLHVHLDAKTREIYGRLNDHFVLELNGEESVVDTVGVQLNKLRQVVQGAVYTQNHEVIELHSHKADMLAELVDAAQGSPILCPIYFLYEADAISKVLGYKVPLIAGSTSASDREHLLEQWDAGKLPLLLCHPASLSHGLNMQEGGHTIVWYSLPWSLEQYKQLNGRLIRPGQNKPVTVYHLVAKDTIDERVARVLADKDATQEDFKEALKI